MLATSAVVALLLSVPSAAAAIPFCLAGTGPGQCNDPEGVAVNEETGAVYVADTANHRVNVFEEDGTFVESFGSEGSGPGQFKRPSQIAVDNDPGPSQGAVYVVDYGNFRLQKFTATGEFLWAIGGGVNTGTSGSPDRCTDAGPPTDVCGVGANGTEAGEFSSVVGSKILVGDGPGDEVYVVDTQFTEPAKKEAGGFRSRLQRFDEAGEPIPAQCLLFDDNTQEGARSLAVASTGSFWVGSESGQRAVRRFDTGCSEEVEIAETLPGSPFGEYTALAVDGEDNLYSVQRETRVFSTGIGYRAIAKYSPTGTTLLRFGYDELQSKPEGLAHHTSALGDLYVSDGAAGIKYLSVPATVPIVPPSSPEPLVVRSVSADVAAEINPEGQETTYRVKYAEKATHEAEGFTGAAEVGPFDLEGEDFALHEAAATIGCKPFTQQALEEGKCLKPQTDYVFGFFADNATGESTQEAIGELQTAPPIEILATWAAEVGSDGAKLRAQVNPLGSEATARFEYVEESAFEESGFAEAIAVPGEAEAPFSFGAGEAPATAGTSISGLAEGTAYRYRLVASNPFVEGVTGPVKRLLIFGKAIPESCANDPFRLGAGALLPDCRAYEQVSPDEKGGGDIKVLPANFTGLPAVLEQSATAGDKLAFGSLQAFAEAESAPWTSQYIAQRGMSGWETHAINPARTNLIFSGLDAAETEYHHFSDDLCAGWMTPFADPVLAPGAEEGFLNLYKRSDELCGERSYETLVPEAGLPSGTEYELELQGVSADESKAIYKASAKLAPQGSAGQAQLYGYSAETGIRMLCIEPGGKPFTGPCTAGTAFSANFATRLGNFTNALAEDASSLYFTAALGEGRIYLRSDPFGAGSTVHVSKAAEEAEGTTGVGSRYRGAAADGSRALFTTGGSLYEYVAAEAKASKVAGQVSGIVGMSSDGTRSYFVSREDLGGEAQAGEPNVYLRDVGAGGAPRFVATLAEEDLDNATTFQPGYHAARVNASGSHMAFMSSSPALAEATAGADISDTESPAACEPGGSAAAICDAEVYLYDAEAEGGAGRLVCASCNPSGARPLGAEPGLNLSYERLAAQLPTFENALYASRALSDDGTRLYFEAADRLVARDTNGRQDVYQWERAGSGGCNPTDPTHNPISGGCVDLISSGQSQLDSRFIDASPSGADVFFATLSSLRATDSGLTDIYDARVGGGYPEPPPPSPECEGEACQSPPPAPRSPTRSSLDYRGPGDLAPTRARKPRRCPKGRHRAKRRGKVRCVRHARNKGKKTKAGRARR